MHRLHTFLRRLVASGLLTGAAAMPAAAVSDVYIAETGLGPGMASGSLQLPMGTANYWAGFQEITVKPTRNSSSSTSFLAYCIDPEHASVSSSVAYKPATPMESDFWVQSSAIQRLFNEYYGDTLHSNLNAAAFQLALWEIADDDGNLSRGDVRSNHNTSQSLVNAANAMLTNVKNMVYNGPDLYNLSVYDADRGANGNKGQDYIVASLISSPGGPISPVPEPNSSLLLLAGVGLLGLVRRCRQS